MRCPKGLRSMGSNDNQTNMADFEKILIGEFAWKHNFYPFVQK